MPWVRFSEAFDWRPTQSVTIAYLPGQVRLVTTACASTAIAKGKAERVKKPASEKKNGS